MDYNSVVTEFQDGLALDIGLLALGLKRAGETGKRDGYLAECERIRSVHGQEVLEMVQHMHSAILLNPELFQGVPNG